MEKYGYPFEIGATVIIDDSTLSEMMRPYYSELIDEVFMVESYMIEDDSHGHVMIKCITDPSKKFPSEKYPVYFHTYIFKSAL